MTVNLPPGPLNLQSGTAYQLAAGVYTTPHRFTGLRDVVVNGVQGHSATLIRARPGAQEAIGFDGCSGITLTKLEISGGTWGVFFARGERLTIKQCDVGRTQAECLLTARSAFLDISDSHFHDVIGDRGHGVYISESCDDVTLTRLLIHGVAAAGLQVNADQRIGYDAHDPRNDGVSERVTLDSCQVWDCGATAYNLSGLRDSVIKGCSARDLRGNAGGIALWDGASPNGRSACQRVAVIGCTLNVPAGRFGIQITRNSEHVSLSMNTILCARGEIEAAAVFAERGNTRPDRKPAVVRRV